MLAIIAIAFLKNKPLSTKTAAEQLRDQAEESAIGVAEAEVGASTATGAVRLEDQHAGAVWIQIANKSMLMNQKLGQRMADECMSPQQFTVAEGFKKNPPPSLLDSPATK